MAKSRRFPTLTEVGAPEWLDSLADLPRDEHIASDVPQSGRFVDEASMAEHIKRLLVERLKHPVTDWRRIFGWPRRALA